MHTHYTFSSTLAILNRVKIGRISLFGVCNYLMVKDHKHLKKKRMAEEMAKKLRTVFCTTSSRCPTENELSKEHHMQPTLLKEEHARFSGP